MEQVDVENEDNVTETTTSSPPVKESTTTIAIEGEDNVPKSTTSCPSAEEGTTTRAITSSRRAYLSWTRTQAASTAPVRGAKVPAYLLLPTSHWNRSRTFDWRKILIGRRKFTTKNFIARRAPISWRKSVLTVLCRRRTRLGRRNFSWINSDCSRGKRGQ